MCFRPCWRQTNIKITRDQKAPYLLVLSEAFELKKLTPFSCAISKLPICRVQTSRAVNALSWPELGLYSLCSALVCLLPYQLFVMLHSHQSSISPGNTTQMSIGQSVVCKGLQHRPVIIPPTVGCPSRFLLGPNNNKHSNLV